MRVIKCLLPITKNKKNVLLLLILRRIQRLKLKITTLPNDNSDRFFSASTPETTTNSGRISAGNRLKNSSSRIASQRVLLDANQTKRSRRLNIHRRVSMKGNVVTCLRVYDPVSRRFLRSLMYRRGDRREPEDTRAYPRVFPDAECGAPAAKGGKRA